MFLEALLDSTFHRVKHVVLESPFNFWCEMECIVHGACDGHETKINIAHMTRISRGVDRHFYTAASSSSSRSSGSASTFAAVGWSSGAAGARGLSTANASPGSSSGVSSSQSSSASSS